MRYEGRVWWHLWVLDPDLCEVRVPLGFLNIWAKKIPLRFKLIWDESSAVYRSLTSTWYHITHAASSPYFLLPALPQVVFKYLRAGPNSYPFLVSPFSPSFSAETFVDPSLLAICRTRTGLCSGWEEMKELTHLIGKTTQHRQAQCMWFLSGWHSRRGCWEREDRGELLEGRVIWFITIKLFPLFSLIKVMQKI